MSNTLILQLAAAIERRNTAESHIDRISKLQGDLCVMIRRKDPRDLTINEYNGELIETNVSVKEIVDILRRDLNTIDEGIVNMKRQCGMTI